MMTARQAAAPRASAYRGPAASDSGRPAASRGDGPAPDDDTLEHWLQVAPVPGWARFAIGRGIWWDPLHAHLRRLCTAGDARRRITNTYLRYARYYLSAQEGTLATEPDAVIR
jgi:hypothetical protein